jgi:hypothetical protein
MPHPIKLIVAVAMYVFAMTSTSSGQTQDLPNAMAWLTPSGTSASNQALDSAGNGAFSGYRLYSMPSSYMPDGMYLPPPRIVWDDTLGYWDNSQVIDAGGYYTDDTNSGMWYSEEAYYGTHPDAISPTGEILQSALYYPNWVINPVWVSTPGYRTISDDAPRQYYATESVNVYVALGDSVVAVQRTLTILEKMPSGDDAQVSSTTSLEAAYLDWSTGLFSTGEFYASIPQNQAEPEPSEGSDATGQTTPTTDLVEVDMGYILVGFGAYHTFTIFTDTSICGGQQYEVRAGPWERDDGSYLGASSEAYTDYATDKPSETVSLQKIGTMETSISTAYKYGQDFVSAVNSSNIGYNFISWGSGYNSNSFTSTFLTYLGFGSVNTTLWTPGFNSNLPPLGIDSAPFNVTGN